MIGIAKKIKVRIKSNVSSYYYPNQSGQQVKHLPGEVIEIDRAFFKPHIMEMCVAPPPKPEPEPEPQAEKEEEPKLYPIGETEEKPDKKKGKK